MCRKVECACARTERMLLPSSQAWDKGRRLAKTVSLQGPWPGEATVKSKSCDEPRSVDLARCCCWAAAERGLEMSVPISPHPQRSQTFLQGCSCPSTHAFCAHLLAATLAAEESGDVEVMGHQYGSRAFQCSLSRDQRSLGSGRLLAWSSH